jgi:hypothetical protein
MVIHDGGGGGGGYGGGGGGGYGGGGSGRGKNISLKPNFNQFLNKIFTLISSATGCRMHMS